MEELLDFGHNARLTIFKRKAHELNPEDVYQVVFGWDETQFVEALGGTIEECVEQLKKDLKNIK